MKLFSNSRPMQNSATTAHVSFSDSNGFGAVASSETRGIPVFAPRGISYRPCDGDRLLILPVDGIETCIGCISPTWEIEGGELKLTSSGGATALFKNNGEISLNGLIITKDGQIRQANGG